jgi:hypothetical protein
VQVGAVECDRVEVPPGGLRAEFGQVGVDRPLLGARLAGGQAGRPALSRELRADGYRRRLRRGDVQDASVEQAVSNVAASASAANAPDAGLRLNMVFPFCR